VTPSRKRGESVTASPSAREPTSSAARLALDYVLTRARLALHVADPVFAIPRWADDAYAAAAFMFVLDRFVGPRA